MESLKPTSIIILGNGRTGSSCLTGLLARNGYWPGDSTCVLPGYASYENEELVALNELIFRKIGVKLSSGTYLDTPAFLRIERLASCLEPKPFVDFIAKCEEHRPWIWKDPRLCITIHFWKKFLDPQSYKLIYLTRSIEQSWIGFVLGGKRMVSFREFSRAAQRLNVYALRFIVSNEQIQRFSMNFDDLQLDPDTELRRLSQYIGREINYESFIQIYSKQLRQFNWNGTHFWAAQSFLILLKLRAMARFCNQIMLPGPKQEGNHEQDMHRNRARVEI